MSHLILPKNYDPLIDLMESQRAIKKIKDYFQQELAYGLNLRRVSAPLRKRDSTTISTAWKEE